METNLPGDPSLVSKASDFAPLIKLAENCEPYKVEDFFKTPHLTALTLSPNGKYIGYLAPNDQNIRNIFIREIGSNKSHQITNYQKRDIANYFWFNNEELGFVVDDNGNEQFKLFHTAIHTKSERCLTPFEKTTVQIIDTLPEQEKHVLIALNKNNERIFDLYRLDIESAQLELIDRNNLEEPISSWMTNDEGEVRAKVAIRQGVNKVIYSKPFGEDDFREIICTNFTDTVSPLLIDYNEPNKLWVRSNLGRDKEVVTAIDMRTGEETGPVLFAHDEVDVGSLMYSRKEKKLLAVGFHAAKPGWHFISDETKAEFETIEALLCDRDELINQEIHFYINSADKEEESYIIHVYNDINAGCDYLYHRQSKNLELLNITSQWLNRDDMTKMEPIQFKSRDDITLNAYLTRPRNHNGEAIPFIMLVHGGPWARDYWGFNHVVQLFASLGFGIMQINFRGSTGYGRTFWKKGFKQWGQDMQNDISDGVKWLTDNNLAIPDKIAIYGGSYGGYATLAGITYTPYLYRCAIDFVGVSNLLTFLNTIPPYWQPMMDMMHEMVGNPINDKKLLEKYSPALNADKIMVPLLVVQGANDARVNIDESDQIVRSLINRDIHVLYMVKYDEGHGFMGEENRVEFHKTMVGFLIQHLG